MLMLSMLMDRDFPNGRPKLQSEAQEHLLEIPKETIIGTLLEPL